jgi:CheY-like chemotaxis protein
MDQMDQMNQSTERIRILVADDHPVFRRGMRAILGAEPDTELVGEATDGEEAISLASKLQPDVILMDLNMPKVGGYRGDAPNPGSKSGHRHPDAHDVRG